METRSSCLLDGFGKPLEVCRTQRLDLEILEHRCALDFQKKKTAVPIGCALSNVTTHDRRSAPAATWTRDG